MTLEEFFKLSWDEQQQIALLVSYRRTISNEAISIKRARAELDEEERELQTRCTHPAVKKTHHRHDEYEGTRYSTDFYCPDCDKHWTEDGTR